MVGRNRRPTHTRQTKGSLKIKSSHFNQSLRHSTACKQAVGNAGQTFQAAQYSPPRPKPRITFQAAPSKGSLKTVGWATRCPRCSPPYPIQRQPETFAQPAAYGASAARRHLVNKPPPHLAFQVAHPQPHPKTKPPQINAIIAPISGSLKTPTHFRLPCPFPSPINRSTHNVR